MDHIEEHILELYVLGAKKIEGKRDEIASHLADCEGCRALAEEMAAFYRAAEDNVAKLRHVPDSRALVPVHTSISPFQHTHPDQLPEHPPVSMGRLRYFLFRHPVSSEIGAFAVGAATVATLFSILNSPVRDMNPAYPLFNTEMGLVEIRNKEHQKLWDFPSSSLKEQVMNDQDHAVASTVVADLDGDNVGEVLTIARMGDDLQTRHLRVFDARQRLRFAKDLTQQFHYRDRHYSPSLFPVALVVMPIGQSKTPDIIVAANNAGRSPAVMTRLDARGIDLGEYWHFGNIQGIYSAELGDNNRKNIVLVGTNDTGDTIQSEPVGGFPIAVVINPERILGQKRSTTAPGFAMPASDAEMYYIRFPLSDLDTALDQNSVVTALVLVQEGICSFVVKSGGVVDGKVAQFEYLCDRNLVITEVKSTDVTAMLHAKYRKEGKLTSTLDRAYLENLKNGVRYWDGKQWTRNAVRINSLQQASTNEEKTQPTISKFAAP